jgi:hypothetical protein
MSNLVKNGLSNLVPKFILQDGHVVANLLLPCCSAGDHSNPLCTTAVAERVASGRYLAI